LGRLVPPALRRIVRRGRRRLLPTQEQRSTSERRRRQELLESRFQRLSGLPRPRAVILTQPSSYQQIGGATDGRRQDPDLGSVIPALLDSGIEPIVVGLGANKASEEDWEVIEGDDRMVPSFAVKARWGRGEDDARSEAATAAVLARSAAASNVPLVIDGTDLGPSFVEELRGLAGQIVRRQSNELARAERLVADLAPGALVTTHEHHRTAWILAANRAGIPTFALQHGVLYPAHPGYPDRRAPGVILPSLTFVFGEAERRVLLDTAYGPDEVEVSGSPRLDRDATVTTTADSAAARRDVRRELGVADEDLLLVVSTVPAPFIRRFHVVHMLETVLGGPLPGVHVVFKQHPGERDSWPYRDFLHGLARAGAYEGPPISVVRDIDLYRLLRAADAHLGQQSTVLTDAVLAGTCNLIAIVEPGGDLLGYVAAGVAHPVRSVADVRAALTDLRPPSETARAAFMAEHARPGGASARIAATVAAAARAASNHATA
jgi:hypothetical protein